MKLLFVTWQFPNFANTFILNEIVELLRQGHEVLVGSILKPERDLLHEDVLTYNLLKNTFYFDDFSLADAALPDNVARFACGQFSNAISNAFTQVAAMIKQQNIQFIHADFANLGATAALILSELTSIPFSFETHTLDTFVKFSFAQEKLNRSAFITTESAYTQSYLYSLSTKAADKIYVIRLCPNYTLMDSLPKGPKVARSICSVCRLTPIKGLEHAIRAIHCLRDRFSDLTYQIVGKGELESDLRGLIRDLNLGSFIDMVGPLTNAGALSIMQRSSIFLLPSVIVESGDRDGTPTAIAEAMYLETPVVSSRICGIPEMVRHQETGILTEPGDVEGIASALSWLLSDTRQLRAFAVSGKKSIDDLFNPQYNVRRLVTLFEQHCNGN